MALGRIHIPSGSIAVSLALILSNLRATMFVYLHPDTSRFWSPAWIEILLWLVVVVLVVNDGIRNDLHDELLWRWRKNWVLGVFVLLALLSTFWSMGGTVTLFRALELLLATLAASYLGVRYLPEQLMEFVFWFGVVLLILCIAIVYSAPATGVMDWQPYNGAWRGIYWNRNHLASITALLNAIFLLRCIMALTNRNSKGLLDGFFYLLSLVVLYYAKSATGFILAAALHLFIFCAWLWLRISDKLQKKHYLAIAGVSITGLVLVLANLDFVFGLFNRSTSLTGRVPLWQAILNNAVLPHPWLGNGFGAAWSFESFRVMIMENAGWTAQPLIADNGYLDILLHLGVSGLGIFLVVFFTLLVRSVRYGIGQKTLNGFFPLLIAVYALIANVSFSMFAETEVFVWMLIVAALFMTITRQSA
jgi:exopolysaccharide production protein ExoQ